jgi:hypothetical protein
MALLPSLHIELQETCRSPGSWFPHRNECLAGSHNDWLQEVHPAAFAHGGRRQQAQALAGAGVDLEYRDTPPDLDAFQMKARNDPIIGETKRETRIFMEPDHPAFFLERMIAIFSCLVIALTATSLT